ncbi:RNA polymerase sigma factor [Sulfitobacter aestuarii]|uniref:RNA polymerase sigma factor n=1 Tax=Sulfitobacter aestuarii TaxID=2161676 RepID=A0ABW5U4Q2_9RHOB
MSRRLQAALVTLMPEFRAFARSVSLNPADAEDLVQDAVERALQARGAPSEVPALRRWMFRVIRNLNVDELRKRRVRREYYTAQTRLYDEAPASPDVARDTLVRIAFDTLPPATREILFLIDVMGFRYVEAAEVMEVPVGTVMSRLSRARRVMCEKMAGPAEAVPQRKVTR